MDFYSLKIGRKNFYFRENRSSLTDSIISEVKCGDDLLEIVFLNHFFFFFQDKA